MSYLSCPYHHRLPLFSLLVGLYSVELPDISIYVKKQQHQNKVNWFHQQKKTVVMPHAPTSKLTHFMSCRSLDAERPLTNNNPTSLIKCAYSLNIFYWNRLHAGAAVHLNVRLHIRLHSALKLNTRRQQHC